MSLQTSPGSCWRVEACACCTHQQCRQFCLSRASQGLARVRWRSGVESTLLTSDLRRWFVVHLVARMGVADDGGGQRAGVPLVINSAGRCALLPETGPQHQHQVSQTSAALPWAYLASVFRHLDWLHFRQPMPNSCLHGSAQRPSVTPVGGDREPLQLRHLVPAVSHWAPAEGGRWGGEGSAGGKEAGGAGVTVAHARLFAALRMPRCQQPQCASRAPPRVCAQAGAPLTILVVGERGLALAAGCERLTRATSQAMCLH